MKLRLSQLIKYFPKSNLGKELLIYYNLQLPLLSTFSKVKVKNNLSCGLLILTIDLIMRVRVDLNPQSFWRLGFHLLNEELRDWLG
jgi:hypothetical protein